MTVAGPVYIEPKHDPGTYDQEVFLVMKEFEPSFSRGGDMDIDMLAPSQPIKLAFASLFADISTEMLYPVLPIFLTQTLKASGSIVGLVEGIAQGT